MIFANSLTQYNRLHTRTVKVGALSIGGGAPIRIQSMTTANTMDTQATIAEAITLINAGAELVRITAPSKAEAENLANIKKGLNQQGYFVPLVADIHFTPNAAEIAARIVEKVRVNPGNYADKKKFEHIEYTEKTYQLELDRIQEKFIPLVKICKEYGTAIRIGTNHGSLSDRILSKYGDTPQGMVESAMEFLRIAEAENFYNIVLSMKASNPQVMVQAYRLLVATMHQNQMNYPLHLGVTEAGDGEDGRIKSALGIGALLEDGLGDTIRVSLTEDPVHELPVCKELVKRYKNRAKLQTDIAPIPDGTKLNLFQYKKQVSKQIFNVGGHEVARVIADFSQEGLKNSTQLKQIGHHYLPLLDKWHIGDQAADFMYLGNKSIGFEIPPQLKAIYDYKTFLGLENKTRSYPMLNAAEFLEASGQIAEMTFVKLGLNDLNAALKKRLEDPQSKAILIAETQNAHAMPELRRFFIELETLGINNPVIIHRQYKNTAIEKVQLYAATDVGTLFIDGWGDGIFITQNRKNVAELNNIAFGVLQAARVRISKTEYIACPSCGRTLFNLQETTAKIRAVTNHLKGVKIGIMGCIVNGPGEMADADFGYVGSGIGKITLYKGQEVMKRNLPEENAVDALIQLIKDSDAWIEPQKALA